MKKYLFTLGAALFAVVSLALVTDVQAHTGGKFVSVVEADEMVLESDWAFDNDVDAVECSGRQVARLRATDGAQTFRHFVCRFDYSYRAYAGNGRRRCAVQFQLHVLRNDWEMVGWRDSCDDSEWYGAPQPRDG